MKLVYFGVYCAQSAVGVVKKISTEVEELIRLGIHSELIVCPENNSSYISNAFIRYYDMDFNLFFSKNKHLKRLLFHYYKTKILINEINSLDGSSILYLRYPYPIFFYGFILFKNQKSCKIVTEHNSIEVNEFKLVKNYPLLILDLFLGEKARKYSDGFVGVTDEITQHQLKMAKNAYKPRLTLGNGIDVSSVKKRLSPPFLGDNLDILCVSSVSYWHGLDRLIKGMAAYDGETNIIFHIVGDGPEVETLHKLSIKHNVENNVIFHGFLIGDALDMMFNICHIAVASLGLHRTGLKQGSVLKAREYCARGIPFIYGITDPDFPEDFNYILRVPADDSPINIYNVIQFAKNLYADPLSDYHMRVFAHENLDCSQKMKKLKDFLYSL
jgi:glycosyltransferase involved in cell wall biosynthesis